MTTDKIVEPHIHSAIILEWASIVASGRDAWYSLLYLEPGEDKWQMVSMPMWKTDNQYRIEESLSHPNLRDRGEAPKKKLIDWSLTPEQFASLPPGSLDGSTVVPPPAPIAIVEPVAGETFWIDSVDQVMTDQGVGRALCAVSARGVLAAWVAVTTARKRGNQSYYDRHRTAKGDTHESDTSYLQFGATDSASRRISIQRPEAFALAQWYEPSDPKLDDSGVHNAVSGYAAGACAWFGNTDKKLIAKVKKAQVNLRFTMV